MEILRKEFPDAKLQASTFENFFAALSTIRDKLPVFEMEVGDTWMQGIGTDPKKTAQYRALYRVMSDCVKSGNKHVMSFMWFDIGSDFRDTFITRFYEIRRKISGRSEKDEINREMHN